MTKKDWLTFDNKVFFVKRIIWDRVSLEHFGCPGRYLVSEQIINDCALSYLTKKPWPKIEVDEKASWEMFILTLEQTLVTDVMAFARENLPHITFVDKPAKITD